ncbi:MAG: hypothetical protein ACRD5H_00005, partial [Nitrososphaerales archaeon]
PYTRQYIWDDGRNVVFIDGGVAKMDGFTELGSIGVATPILGMNENVSQGNRNLILGTTTQIFWYDATSTSSIGSGFTGTLSEGATSAATQWSFEPWGSWMLCTNGTNTPQIWRGSGSVVAMGSTTFTKAEIFIRFRDYMIAMNTSNGVNSIEWSDANAPESWTVAPTNSAGQIILRELDSNIISAKPLGPDIAIYSLDSVHMMRFIGLPLVFQVQSALTGIGAVSKHSVVPLNQFNFGLARQGFFTTDGQTYKYIDEPAIRTWFLSRINWGQRSKVVGAHDQDSHQIIWSFPGTGSGENNQAVGFDYVRNLWTMYDQAWTGLHPKLLFDNTIGAQSNGRFYAMHSGTSAAGASLTACITTNYLDFQDNNRLKYISAIKIGALITGSGLRVRAETSNVIGSGTVVGNFISITNDNDLVPIDQTGRFVRFKFKSENTGVAWNIQAIDVYGVLIGNRP